MSRIRNALTGFALGSAILATTQAHAGKPAPVAPSAELAQYMADVRKADAIEDDEARCKAYPDLPGNRWRPGAAQGRCSILRKPAWSLDEIDTLLSTPNGAAELDRRFAALLNAHFEDQPQREQIFIAFNAFGASPRAGEVARRWLALAPQSAFANNALGWHYEDTGWDARGSAYAAKTSEQQLKRMTELFAQAVPLFAKALEIEPRLSVACMNLYAIGRQSSDALQQYAMAHCMKVDPDSYFLAWEWITAAQPKWGGSDEQLRALVAYAAARTERNPILGALLGEAAGYRPSLASSLATVTDELAAVALLAPSGGVMSSTGRGYWSKRDPWPAMVHLSQASRFWPDDARVHYARASLLHDWLGDSDWAKADLQVALAEAPDDARYLYLMGRIVNGQEGPSAARPYFKRAMADPEQRQQAMQMYCQTYVRPHMPKEADDCTREVVIEFPQSGEAWRLRAWALYEARNPEALDAAHQFSKYAKSDKLHQRDLEIMKSWKLQLQAQ